MQSGSRQLEIDWSRGRQLAILRDCVLPDGLLGHDGRGVSASCAKLVLSLLDHFGRGSTAWVSLETLRQKANLKSVRTVIRATQALEAASLLCIETDGRRRCNRYTLVWSELALLCPDSSYSSKPATPCVSSGADDHVSATMAGQRAGTVQRPEASVTSLERGNARQSRQVDLCHFAREPSDTGTEPSDTGTEPSDTRVTLTDIETGKEPPPPYPPTCSEPRNGVQPVSWGSAAAEIRSYGVQRTTDAIRYAKMRGVRPEDLLDALRTCRANERLFARPQAALVDWCRSGDWPADGVQDWQTVESLRQRTAERRASAGHHSTCMDAWRAVRDRTPRGEIVDDRVVVEEAIGRGVPRDVALQFAGLEVTV